MSTMERVTRATVTFTVVAVVGASLAEAASGQLANASARTLGMGGSTTATAAHLEALSVNPAGLGMPGAGFSLALLPLTARSGLGPVTLGDVAAQGGKVVSDAVKEAWLEEIAAQGSQSGSAGVEIALIALTAGRFGFQISTLAGGDVSIGPDIAEAALYGNAGRTGAPSNLSMAGSSLNGFGVTTAAMSVGLPLNTEAGAMAFGATVKYSLGHVVAVGRDQGGSFTSDPIRVRVNFPTVTFDEDAPDAVIGSGVGLDVGFQMQRERARFGAAVLNVVHSFAWDGTKLAYRPGTAILEQGNSTTDFDKQPYASAPAVLRSAVDDMRFDPVVALGGAYDVQPDFTVSADVRNRFGDGMSLTPKLHAGVGAEYRGIRALHLRGGAGVVTGGIHLAGGAALNLGPVSFSFATALQTGESVSTRIAHFALVFGGR